MFFNSVFKLDGVGHVYGEKIWKGEGRLGRWGGGKKAKRGVRRWGGGLGGGKRGGGEGGRVGEGWEGGGTAQIFVLSSTTLSINFKYLI